MDKVDRARIPDALCEHIVEITEDYVERLDMANEYLESMGRKSLTPVLDESVIPKRRGPQPRLF